MTRGVMEKSIGIIFLQVIGAAIVCGLSVAGTGSASSITNNSLNPYSPTSGSSSTASSILESYLQTFPVNEQQNILTTVYHASAKQHLSTTTGNDEKEKLTTSSASSSYSSTTHLATESSQSSSPNQNTQTPFVISTGPSVSVPTTGNILENPEQPVLISNEPIFLGCGPNNREGIGIQKALDWLREKRVSDYGWENDTHMVILAKEVRNCRGFEMGWGE